MENKQCFKCSEVKPLNDFYKHGQMKDGRVNKCKECNKLDVRLNRLDKVEHYRDYDKSRDRLPHRKKLRVEFNKRWILANPIKCGAQTMVGNHVRDGKLIKPTDCSECGTTERVIHGHHDDYSKPLDVRWLCPVCHRAWHDQNGKGING